MFYNFQNRKRTDILTTQCKRIQLSEKKTEVPKTKVYT